MPVLPREFQTGGRQRGLTSLALIILVLMQSQAAVAWGNEGHTAINRVAAEKIPTTMPQFMRRAVAQIAYLGPEPDRWRSPSEFALKNSQDPDHFIDLERVSWLDPLPAGRYEFYRKLYEKRSAITDHPDDYLPERVGLQPYITMEVYGRLKASFREYRQRRATHQPTQAVERTIIFYAGWLGHYVADGSQPLHTTIRYPNGYTTEHGIHAQFENAYVAANITAKDFSRLVKGPELLDDPFGQYIAYLKQSNSRVNDVYAFEKAEAFAGRGSAAAFDFTTRCLAAGSQMLLNLWYTAWIDSSAPVPEHSPASPSAK